MTSEGGKTLLLNFCAEKIGGIYYMKLNPESIYEKVLGRSDPWTSQFAPEGEDIVGSMFGDSFRG